MSEFKLGLRENKNQFILLVIVNAFVGAMVGLERSVFPSLAKEQFGLESAAVILSFIVVFGLVKAGANFYAGALSDKIGRKKMLIIGWLFAIPVPFLIRYAPNWNWIVVANIFLGINQGLAWSSTVIMKIDLVGPKRRGFAMGINEFAGYIAVALTAYFTAQLASEYGLQEVPFLIGLVVVAGGLISSVFFVKDTRKFVVLESSQSSIAEQTRPFLETTFFNRNLSAITQAGMVNNLNDGMIWGLLPLFMIQFNFNLSQIAWAAGLYPAVWGVGQLFTGAWGDKVPKKNLLVAGMLLQGLVLVVLSKTTSYEIILLLAALLGFGTALVYPNFLAGISENTHPNDRAKSIGVFRLWRDSGYAIGAVLSGIIAQQWSISMAILVIGIITVFSSIVIQLRMRSC
jgi:MFS family permease